MPRLWSGLLSDLSLRLGRHYPAPSLQIILRLVEVLCLVDNMSFCLHNSLDKGMPGVPILRFKGFLWRSDWIERNVLRIILSSNEDEGKQLDMVIIPVT